MKKSILVSSVLFVILFSFFLISNPDECKTAVISGIVLCGNVIIPSLFPFTFCSLYILNSKIKLEFSFLNKITMKLFSLEGFEFTVFILSLIGGYPTGAKLVNELYKSKKISRKKANFMLCYCINSGPAFLIMTIGSAQFSSKELGYILFSAHILSSFLIAAILKRFTAIEKFKSSTVQEIPSVSNNLITSISDAAASILSICSYVILFSVINCFLNTFLGKIPFLKFLPLVSEITLAITKTKNIYLIAFLCGFAGISIWFQIMAQTKDFKKNIPLFILFRVIHGLFCFILTFCFVRIFGVALPTISNGISIVFSPKYSSYAFFVSLLMLGVLFIISLENKKVWQNS